MDGVIDLTGEDSGGEVSDPFDCSSDDDLKPANINAQGNNLDYVRRYYNVKEAEPGPTTSQSTNELAHVNVNDSDNEPAHVSVNDSDNEFLLQENEDIGWPPRDIDSENDFDDAAVAEESEDRAYFDWQANAMSPAVNNSDSAQENDSDTAAQEDEDMGCVPKAADLHQSLRHFHPLSDSNDSDAPFSSPPPKKKVASNNKTTSAAATKNTKKASPSKGRKRKTPEEKAEEEAEKLHNRKQKEALRRLRPENCLKHIVVELDTSITSIPALSAMLLSPPLNQLKHKLRNRNNPNTIGWHRQVLSDQDEDVEECNQLMLQIMEMNLLENLVYSNQLLQYVSELFEDHPNINKLAFIVFDSKQYFKNNSGKKKKDSGTISKNQLDEAIAECQIEKGVTFRLLDTAQEVAEWVYRYSKSVAEHPFKISKKTWQDSFRFDLGVEKGQGLRIGTAAEGLPQLWMKILRKFRRATIDHCQAIAEAYPSPCALFSAYENCKSEQEARKLLQNIQMQKGAGPMAVNRKVGPVLSRKIHTLFTSLDPAALLSDL